MQPPIHDVTIEGAFHHGVHTMDQSMPRAKVANSVGGPWAARFPCNPKRLGSRLCEKAGKVVDVLLGSLKRCGTLEQDNFGSRCVGDFKSFRPSLPYLGGVLKRPKECTAFRVDRLAQTPVGGARRRMGDQLPCLHAEDEIGRGVCSPSGGDGRGWRVIEGGLDLDRRKLRKVFSLASAPAAAADQSSSIHSMSEQEPPLGSRGGQCSGTGDRTAPLRPSCDVA